MKILRKLFTLTFLVVGLSTYAQVIPLPNAHSHNDYNRRRPLKDALKNGFTSVEADVIYIYGNLLVGHDMPDKPFPKLKPLKRLYLKPLYRHWKRNKKEIFKGYEGDFYLWIDIKAFPNQTYSELRDLLFPYRKMLNYWENGKFHKGKVTIVLSGDRPFDALRNDTIQLMTIDGRPEDLEKDYPKHLMIFVSENVGKVAGVNHPMEGTEETFERIYDFVERAHRKGKKTRLWATPEDEKLWSKLLTLNIDLINTNKLSKLRKFLLAQNFERREE